MESPKILFLDIETSPNLATVWGIWQQNIAVSQLLETSYVLCWSAKWKGTKGTLFDSVERSGKAGVVKSIYRLLEQSDIVVHYNGKRFDIPTLNKEFLLLGLKPPRPFKQIDLFETVKKQFRFTSNKLAHVTEQLGFKGKIATNHQLWLDCMNNDRKAWEKMERYNKRDVTELEKVYNRVLPWITNMPNVGMFSKSTSPTCVHCGSGRMQSRGLSMTKTHLYKRYQCQACGSWSRSRHSERVRNKNILTQC